MSEPGKIALVLALSVLAHGIIFAAFSWAPMPSWVPKISESLAIEAEEPPQLEVTLIAVTPQPSRTQFGLVEEQPEPEEGEGSLEVTEEALPEANYDKAVSNAIGVRFDRLRKTWPESLIPGEVRVQFILNADGSASDIRVLSNTAGPSTAACAEAAVREARIPPIPADRRAQAAGGRLKIVYNFIVYPQ